MQASLSCLDRSACLKRREFPDYNGIAREDDDEEEEGVLATNNNSVAI